MDSFSGLVGHPVDLEGLSRQGRPRLDRFGTKAGTGVPDTQSVGGFTARALAVHPHELGNFQPYSCI